MDGKREEEGVDITGEDGCAKHVCVCVCVCVCNWEGRGGRKQCKVYISYALK